MNYSDETRWLTQDFQGWPVCKLTLREILEGLGATWKDGRLGFEESEFLDSFPVTLEDDGMAYGVNKMFFTDAHTVEKDGHKEAILFREKYNVKMVNLMSKEHKEHLKKIEWMKDYALENKADK